MVKNHHLGNTL